MGETAESIESKISAEAEGILQEVRQRMGYVPPAISAAARTGEMSLRAAWLTTCAGYLDNPLPARFKEQFLAAMSRRHRSPYCMIMRTCALRRLGAEADEIVELLTRKLPTQTSATEGLRTQAATWTQRSGFATMPRELERWVLWASLRVALRRDRGSRCRNSLHEILGEADFNHLVMLTSYASMQQLWTDAHLNADVMIDEGLKAEYQQLVVERPEFSKVWENLMRGRTRHTPSSRERKLLAEIARQDQARLDLRDSERRFRKVIRNAPFPAMLYTEDGQILMLNRAWRETSGWSEKTTPTVQRWMELAQVDRTDWSTQDLEALDGWEETIEEGEYRIRTRSGEIRCWDFFTASLGRLPDGRRLVLRMATDITERKRLETQLWQTNRRVGSILDSITDGFIAMDRETRFLYYNRNAEHILKVKCENALGKKFLEAFPIPESAPLYQAIMRCLNERVTQHVEHYSTRANTVYEVQLYPSEEGLSAYFRDIAERKQMEHRLRASERRFRRLFESDMLGIMFANRFTGAILDCNDAMLKVIGYTRQDMEEGRLNWIKLTPPEFRALDTAATSRLADGPLEPYEKEFVHKDGHRVSILIGGAPVTPDDDVVMAFVIDRSEQKASEERIERVHRLLDDVMQVTPVSTLVLDLQGRVILWNRASAEMFGFAEDDVLGKPLMVIAPEEQERFGRMLKQLSEGTPFSGKSLPAWRKDGTKVYVNVEARPVRDGRGRVVALMSVATPAEAPAGEGKDLSNLRGAGE